MSYTWDSIPDSYADNAKILTWWSSYHDDLIRTKSSELAWLWPWSITDAIIEITSPETMLQWRAKDPLCEHYAWYNILMYFAIARANRHGLRVAEQQPQNLVCARCRSHFNQSNLPPWTVKRLGRIEALRFCAPCCKSGFFGRDANGRCTKRSIKHYLQQLHHVSGVIPNANFFDTPGPLIGLDVQTQCQLLDIGAERPSNECIKRKYSSHLAALIDAGILPDGTRKTSRGVQCLAEDGHLCLSLGEKMIDDWLHHNNFQHDKEPPYPNSNMRADFKVGDILIEYFGLAGDAEYDHRIVEKRQHAAQHSLRVLEIYPDDLNNSVTLDEKLRHYLK